MSYMGCKNQYAFRIVNKIRQYTANPLLYDLCCGSGAISDYWHGETIMIDAGPYGDFWRIVSEHSIKDFNTNYSTTDALVYFMRQSEFEPVPSVTESPIEYALRFAVLQIASFNGKPVNDKGGRWQHEGLIPKYLTLNRWRDFWTTVTRIKEKIKYARRLDVHKCQFTNSNLYIDPDYESTTGYPYTVRIKAFVEANQATNNIFLSHHVPLHGIEWDQIFNVTAGHRSFARVNTELLHIRLSEEYQIFVDNKRMKRLAKILKEKTYEP